MDLLGSLEKKIVAGSLTALGLVLLISIISLVSIQRLVSSAEQVRNVQSSIERLDATLSHLKDTETGTRGFYITGKSEFLEPYQSAYKQLTLDLKLLPVSLHHSNNTTYHLPHLQTLIRKKLLLSQQIIDLRKKEALAQATQLLQIEEGKRLMDQIRVLISQMQTQERSLLEVRERENRQLLIFARIVILSGSLIAIGSVLLAVIFIRRDVVKRRQAEMKLLTSEQLLNEAQGIAKMGSWEYDVVKDQLSVSAALYELFEVDEAKNKLKTSGQFYEYVHPEDVQQLHKTIGRSITSGESFQTEHRLLLPSGKQKYILSNATPVQTLEGNVSKLRGTCQDITDLKHTQQALIQSEKLFSTIFQLSPFPSGITRLADGKVIVANKKALQVFGYSALEVSNLTTVELKLWNNAQEREKLLQQVKQEPIIEFEKRYFSKEGKPWDAITYIELIEWEQEPCLLIILQDITEHKKAEQAIHAYAEELKQLNLSKDTFFSLIAHDLLSPLNGVLGSADLLANHLNNLQTQDIQKLSQGIHASTTHLKRLLINLLEWARLQKGELSFQPIKVNLYKIVMEEIAFLQENSQQKGLTIEVFTNEQLLVEADAHMLSAVIRNLLANAIKFSNQGGNIQIQCEETATEVQISVRDKGIGMSKQVKERLFQVAEKQTSVGTAGEKGTGLGLILCKEFVERHGGIIWVESEQNKGTTFTFTLPKLQLL